MGPHMHTFALFAMFGALLLIELGRMRWHGKLSFTADDLLWQYGPIVRISPNIVLVNDYQALNSIFSRKDLNTAPKAIRALQVGGHDWTVTYPQNHIARERRLPVMTATTTKNLKYLLPIFEDNITDIVKNLSSLHGTKSEDIFHHLRINTLRNSQVVMGGSGVKLDHSIFPHVVGEYNFLVVWRLCLPEWLFSWRKFGPFSCPPFRVRSSDLLFKLGGDLCKQPETTSDPIDHDDAPTVYRLFTTKDEKNKGVNWTHAGISAEVSGQILVATETTSSALVFIFYELAKSPGLIEKLYQELQAIDGYNNIEISHAPRRLYQGGPALPA
ncbi:hypothetical protein OIDMADRAFT_149907 [Oidiodendron maius Zn]|uniref:Cytochrome P450 n=1 Tax=Oidiodendron maius (strain Zn) TaxID=913774 RepID=A0A0C3CTE0_OIDMZ|nr:hypothetical protein OIDMADRAFT_149907 [Oidiodendron maius Zn]